MKHDKTSKEPAAGIVHGSDAAANYSICGRATGTVENDRGICRTAEC